MQTIEEAKAFLKANYNTAGGTKCPCCGQHVKLYKRLLSSSMARQLIELYRIAPTGRYIHLSQMVLTGMSGAGDFSKLHYWGLIYEKPKDNEKDGAKKTSGYWKITDKGISFVKGLIQVNKYAYIYNTRCYDFSAEQLTISESLGKHFNYHKLMASTI